MPLPLDLGGLVVGDLGSLGYAVAWDLARGGGEVYVGVGPDVWVPVLVAEGRISEEEASGLIRALLGRTEPAFLGLAVSLARAIRPADLGPWLVAALVQHDTGTLLALDGDRTVEEQLARAAAELCPLADAGWRATVLQSLRAVGAADAEARVLAVWGTADELAEWGPPLVASGDPAVLEALRAGLDGEHGAQIEDLLDPW